MRFWRDLLPVLLFFSGILATNAVGAPGSWTGNYLPCDRHADLLNRSHMDLAVRFSTSNGRLAMQFAYALDFWATVLDMDWRREDSRACSLAVVDGNGGLFQPGQLARAQFPNASAFQGWVALNPNFAPGESEQYFVAVHELGHLFGLTHNPNPSSVMFFLYTEGVLFLDKRDLQGLAARHRLRGTGPGESQRQGLPVLVDPLKASQIFESLTPGQAPARLP